MKISEVLRGIECDKKAKFSNLVDRTKANNWKTFKNCLLEKKEKLEGYEFEAKVPLAIEKEKSYIETLYSRLLKHLSQYFIKDTNIFYEIDVNGKKYSGKADFLLEKSGIETVVLLKAGKNNFSKKARKAENKAENSLELLALKQAFPKARAELWFLKGAKETSTNYSDVFDNVVELPEEIDVIEKIRENFEVKMEKDCSNCPYSSLCKEDLRVAEQTEEKTLKQAVVFTPEQEKVIALKEGVYSVLAGAGSGKTKVIVERVKNLKGKVLLITFTRKATAEIESRLGQVNNVEVSTIDSLVRKFCKGMEYTIADKISKARLIEKALIIKNLDISYADMYMEFGLISKLIKVFDKFDVNAAKNFKLSEEEFLDLYDEYRRLYKENNYMSYEELTQYVVENNLAKTYDYVIVDEAQDISQVQYNLIRQLSPNIMLVGDDDQSIYGFRNGSNEFLLNLNKDYSNAKMLILSRNFRSSKQIVSLGSELLSFNKNRCSKVLTANRDGSAIKVGIDIEEIKKMEGTTGIIARNHNYLERFSKSLDKANIKYNKDEYLVDNIDTFRNIVNLYCNRDNWDNDILVFQLVQKLDLFLELTEEDYLKNNAPMIEKLEEYAYYKITDIFYNLDRMSYEEQLMYLFDRLSIPENIVEKLVEIPVTTLRELNTYLIDMIRFFDDTKIDAANETVTLLTAHSSKGKEFDNVVVLNIDGFFENAEDIEEARRLLYVAISRAKNRLVLESNIIEVVAEAV